MAAIIGRAPYMPKVLSGDRVQTKTSRKGWVIGIVGQDTALVHWDDGATFAIRFAHLEVIQRGLQKGFRTNS